MLLFWLPIIQYMAPGFSQICVQENKLSECSLLILNTEAGMCEMIQKFKLERLGFREGEGKEK